MSNTKPLILFSLLIIIAGLTMLWFGFRPTSSVTLTANLSPVGVSSSLPTSKSPATSSAALGIEGEQAYVDRVIDGDTIEVEMNGAKKPVRLIGMNTPETVDPKKPVECYGKEASNETKSLLTGKTVILQKDATDTDKYKRLLRFVFLPLENGDYLFVDDFLVREGYAKILIIPPNVKYSEQLLQAQNEARQARKGLWGAC